MRGLVFSIEEFAVYDGPGIRSTVFLKGCPMKCNWCHNPEGMSPKPQMLRNFNSCVKCGRCAEPLKRQECGEVLDPDTVGICPVGALRYSGTYYEPGELAERLLKNSDIYERTGGGVTFSGGDPLCQHEFLAETLALLEGKVHTAVETSGYASGEVFERIVGLASLMMMDLKIINSVNHEKYIGCDNKPILENFRRLRSSGKKCIIRVPLIPGVTDTEENLSQIAELCAGYDNIDLHLLSYNKFAGGKYAMAGKKYSPKFDESIASEPRLEIFEAKGIKAKLYS